MKTPFRFASSLRWAGLAAYVAAAGLIIVFLTPIGGWKALDVLTGSMRPAIQPGALVLIHKVPLSSVHPGNVVTYVNPHDPAETITHRVTSLSKDNNVTMVTVKGDANAAPDPAFPGGQIKGRVAAIIPGAGRLLNIVHNAWGLALVVILPALLVILTEIRTLRRILSDEALRQRRAARAAQLRRRLDGMSRTATPLVGLLALVVIAGGVTLAAVTSTVSLTGNHFATAATGSPSPTPTPSGSPSPTPTPSGSPTPTAAPCPTNVTITDTGAGSTNIVKCISKTTITNINSNHTTITNSNHQTATSGRASNGNSGNSTNNNTTATIVTTTF